MAEPTSRHRATYTDGRSEAAPDGRLFSPVFDRNAPPLIAALAPWLGRGPGRVLEIGAGTGQHAAAFQLAFPARDWVPSDPVAGHRASIAAWRSEMRLPARAALDLDAAGAWAETEAVRALAPITAVFAANVLHVAPWAVAQGLLHGAGAVLGPGGLVVLYGPFARFDAPLTPGNAAFDARLRADDPAWGLRNLRDLIAEAATHGLELAGIEAMPANNTLLILRKIG